jgi:hypothetical protein
MFDLKSLYFLARNQAKREHMIPSSIVKAANLAKFRVCVPKELSHNYNLIICS